MDGVTPVSVVFGPAGVQIISIKGGSTYRRVIPWKEAYKMGLRGEKVSGPAFVKEIARQVSKAVDSNIKNMNSNKEFLKGIKKRKILLPPPLPPRSASAQ